MRKKYTCPKVIEDTFPSEAVPLAFFSAATAAAAAVGAVVGAVATGRAIGNRIDNQGKNISNREILDLC
ncbi:hypothetical protein TI04_09580 [Achromatium sp. WMS2]|nr:hypothetical protein TI04_09580 [Achromatium sp. WMS2]